MLASPLLAPITKPFSSHHPPDLRRHLDLQEYRHTLRVDESSQVKKKHTEVIKINDILYDKTVYISRT